MEELTILDFLAQLINDQKSRQQGYAAAPRWLCTNQKSKDECLKEANQMFEDWKNNELEAYNNRQNLLKDIKYY